ncbi:uncharacterized protein LOC143239008 isoform X2 [Tachypleus tridentatus]|uniref:uncharacterized protein LOC143239008 isoform X2 n=1 Tax=Tachypleus tridentatus TaxID=6853 RepID=UPI003FD52119
MTSYDRPSVIVNYIKTSLLYRYSSVMVTPWRNPMANRLILLLLVSQLFSHSSGDGRMLLDSIIYSHVTPRLSKLLQNTVESVERWIEDKHNSTITDIFNSRYVARPLEEILDHVHATLRRLLEISRFGPNLLVSSETTEDALNNIDKIIGHHEESVHVLTNTVKTRLWSLENALTDPANLTVSNVKTSRHKNYGNDFPKKTFLSLLDDFLKLTSKCEATQLAEATQRALYLSISGNGTQDLSAVSL